MASVKKIVKIKGVAKKYIAVMIYADGKNFNNNNSDCLILNSPGISTKFT